MSAVKGVIIGVTAVAATVGALYGLYRIGEKQAKRKADAEAAERAAKADAEQKQADVKAESDKASEEIKERCKSVGTPDAAEQLIRVRTVTEQDTMHSNMENVYQVISRAFHENRLHMTPWAEGDVPDALAVQIRRYQQASPQEILLKPSAYFNSPVRDKAVVGVLQKRGIGPVIFVQCNDVVIAMHRDDRYFSVSGMDSMTGNEAADAVLMEGVFNELYKELGITQAYIKSVVGE